MAFGKVFWKWANVWRDFDLLRGVGNRLQLFYVVRQGQLRKPSWVQRIRSWYAHFGIERAAIARYPSRQESLCPIQHQEFGTTEFYRCGKHQNVTWCIGKQPNYQHNYEIFYPSSNRSFVLPKVVMCGLRLHFQGLEPANDRCLCCANRRTHDESSSGKRDRAQERNWSLVKTIRFDHRDEGFLWAEEWYWQVQRVGCYPEDTRFGLVN